MLEDTLNEHLMSMDKEDGEDDDEEEGEDEEGEEDDEEGEEMTFDPNAPPLELTSEYVIHYLNFLSFCMY